MSKLLHTITRDSDVGIWHDQTSTARIYNDKIIIGQPYVKWVDNSGNLNFRKVAIRNQIAIDGVITDMNDDREEDAWGRIDNFLTYYA